MQYLLLFLNFSHIDTNILILYIFFKSQYLFQVWFNCILSSWFMAYNIIFYNLQFFNQYLCNIQTIYFNNTNGAIIFTEPLLIFLVRYIDKSKAELNQFIILNNNHKYLLHTGAVTYKTKFHSKWHSVRPPSTHEYPRAMCCYLYKTNKNHLAYDLESYRLRICT